MRKATLLLACCTKTCAKVLCCDAPRYYLIHDLFLQTYLEYLRDEVAINHHGLMRIVQGGQTLGVSSDHDGNSGHADRKKNDIELNIR